MVLIDMQYFGGNGAASGKSGGAGRASGGGANLLKTELDTPQKQRAFLRNLEDGEQFDIVSDYSDRTVTKMEGIRKYDVQERGIRYNPDGSYTPYQSHLEVGESVVLRYMKNARSVRNRRK